jgi:hypothetical protein
MPIQSMLQLPNSRYALSFEQRQRVEGAAATLPAAQRPTFRQRVRQVLWRMPSRGVTSDAMIGVAISAAQRELSERAAS